MKPLSVERIGMASVALADLRAAIPAAGPHNVSRIPGQGQGCSRFSVLVGVDFKVASKTIPNCRVKVFQNDE